MDPRIPSYATADGAGRSAYLATAGLNSQSAPVYSVLLTWFHWDSFLSLYCCCL